MLATLLVAPKPLVQSDLKNMMNLKNKSKVSKLLGRYNRELVSRSECSIGAGLLLGGLLHPLSDNEKLYRLNNATKMMQKPSEIAPPTYGQALRRACFYGNNNVVDIILANVNYFNIDINEVTPANGRSPLHWAIYKDNIKIANSLISAGCDVNKQDIHNNSPMHYLVRIIQTKGISMIKKSCFELLMLNNSQLSFDNIEQLTPAFS